MNKLLIFIALSLAFSSGYAQFTDTRCASDEIRQRMLTEKPGFADMQRQLEAFTANYIQQLPAKKTRATLYRIPVVVHVIHNGEAIGSGANISVAQINSQIAVLNKDYRLKNTDSLKPTHVFWPVTDDCEIEFCLATLDPNGQLTSGIDRFDYGQSSYDYTYIESIIKANSIWNHQKYLNIWVVTLGGTASGLLGYATPPGTGADEDGIVIGTKYFGTTGNVQAPYNKGRTTTHEIGHYFNLRHIWGDQICGTDMVTDTTPAEDANYGCPTFPYNANNGCGAGANGEMYMNYMDYTDDACMKMFTTGQKSRMRAVLTGTRAGLATSLGCTWPVGLDKPLSTLSLKVFPNPCDKELYVQLDGTPSNEIQLEVYNAFGQPISASIETSQASNGRFVVRTHALPNGTYFVRFKSALGSGAESFTIIR